MTRLPAHLAFALAALMPLVARAQLVTDEVPEIARGADVRERLGEPVPRDIRLTNAKNEKIELGDYIDGEKPLLLAMVYYDCPMICTLVLDQLNTTLADLDYTVGEDFNVAVVSFDHLEHVSQAAAHKAAALAGYGRTLSPDIRAGYAFHVAEEKELYRLSRATGFHYRKLDNGEYAHPVALIILTPDGRVGRYVYGLEYPTKRLKLALLDASEGKIAKSLGDYFLHLCFRYDPNAGAYSVEAMTAVRIGGIITMLALGTLIVGLKWGERVRKKRKQTAEAVPGAGVLTGHTA